MESPLASAVLLTLGPLTLTRPVVTSWGVMALLTLVCWRLTRRLSLRPNRRQAAVELLVTTLLDQIEEVLRRDPRPFLPFLGTLFLFLLTANLSGLLPGIEAPTSKLETTAALALLVFAAVQGLGVHTQGFFGYLAGFAQPKIFLLPLNLLSELTRHAALAVRLFGNVMSGEFVIALLLALSGLFVPIPLMALEVLVGIVQAYVFTILATVFIGAAVGSVERG